MVPPEPNTGSMKVYDLNIALSQPEAVTELYLTNRDFRVFPMEILTLKNLNVLELSSCQLEALPAEITLLDQLCVLKLRNNGLVDLPESITQLPLLVLNLERNGFQRWPEVISQLTDLRKLNLAYNLLAEIPESLFSCTHLQTLDLSYNQIRQLPESIKSLGALKELHLKNNQLQQLPEALFYCKKLETLVFTNNQLSKIPQGIGRLKALENLDLRDNRLIDLSSKIGQCTELKRLILSGNQLRKIPASLGTCQKLILLDVSQNQLTALPEKMAGCKRLENLDVSENRFKKLPGFLTKLPRLTNLNASENQLVAWPKLPSSVARLNLSANPLTAVASDVDRLVNLQEINLNWTKLKKLPKSFQKLGKLTTATAKGVLLIDPAPFLYLKNVQDLQGFAKPDAIQLVRYFRYLIQGTPIPERFYQPVYKVIAGDITALARVPVLELFAWLRFPKLEFLARRELLRRYPGNPENLLQTGSVLSVAGTTYFDTELLAEKLSSLGIQYLEQPSNRITHVLLGKQPDFHRVLAQKELTYLTEENLTGFLNSKNDQFWHLISSNLAKINELLCHEDPANIAIGLHLLQHTGVYKWLWNELLLVYIKHQSGPNNHLSKMAHQLLMLNLPEKERQIIGEEETFYFPESNFSEDSIKIVGWKAVFHDPVKVLDNTGFNSRTIAIKLKGRHYFKR